MSINSDISSAGLNPRIGLIVFLKNVSDQYKLRRFGDIVYFSKKMKYCVIYVDHKQATKIKNEIAQLYFVKKVAYSEDDNVNLDSQHIEDQIHKLAIQAEQKLQENNGEFYN